MISRFDDGLGSANLIATSGTATDTLAASYVIRDNILRSSRSAAMVVTGGGVSYANNLFSGVTAVGTAPQSGDAMFVNSATHPNGGMSGPALWQLAGFQMKTGARTADIGPYEAP